MYPTFVQHAHAAAPALGGRRQAVSARLSATPRPGQVASTWPACAATNTRSFAVVHHRLAHPSAHPSSTTRAGQLQLQCCSQLHSSAQRLPAGTAVGRSCAAEAPTPMGNGSSTTYTVQDGDTMGSIAARAGISLQRLIELNPQIKNPNIIGTGQVINVEKGSSDSGFQGD